MLPPKPHKIPGSIYWRVWCVRCKEPMRVRETEKSLEHYCEQCGPKKPPPHLAGLTPRQKSALKKTQS